MTHLYLIRHADYLYDLVDGQYPKQNLGLSEEGKQQAERLRARLVNGEIKPDVFLSSSERGARETAEVLAPALGLPFTLDDSIIEWRSEDGTLTTEEFMEPWRQLNDLQKPFHRWLDHCESWIEFSARVQTALHRITQVHEGKTILLVTHGGIIQVSFYYFFGLGLSTFQRASTTLKNTSITHWFKIENPDKWVLERFNDHHHLG